MSRSLGATFITEKNRTWARPFLSAVFHFGGTVADVYLCNRDITIGGNAHVGAIRNWGEFRAASDPRDGTFQTASITLDVDNFPVFGSPAQRFTDLWAGGGIEGVEVDVYQNFRQVGTATILQEILFAAVVRPVQYDPNICSLELLILSDKYLDKKEISFPLTLTDFPAMGLSQVAKIANVVYGSAKKVPAVPLNGSPASILRDAMDAAQTNVPIYSEFYDLIDAAGSVQTGAEKITYTGKRATTVVGANLVTNGNATDLASYATASITPTGNDLILAWIENSKATTPDTPALSGNSFTWVQVATVVFSSGTRRLTLCRAMGGAPSAGAVTIDFGGNMQTGCGWSIVQFSGVDTGGANGSAAVVQWATNSVAAGTTLSSTLAAFATTENATAAGFSLTVNSAVTPGAGYSELADAGHSTPNSRIETEWRDDGDIGPSASFSSADAATIAVEIAGAALPRLTGATRAASHTVATTHLASDTIVFFPTALYYLVAGHAVHAINNVYVRQNGTDVPVDSSRWTAEVANTTLVAGKTLALVKFTAPPLNVERLYRQTGTFNTSNSTMGFGGQDFAKTRALFHYHIECSWNPATVIAGSALYVQWGSTNYTYLLKVLPSGAAAFGVTSLDHWDSAFHQGATGNMFSVLTSGSPTVLSFNCWVEYLIATTLADPLADLGSGNIVSYKQQAGQYGSAPPVTFTIGLGAQDRPKANGQFHYTVATQFVVANAANFSLTINRNPSSSTESPLVIVQCNSAGQIVQQNMPIDWYDDHWHTGSAGSCFQIVASGTFGANDWIQVDNITVEYNTLNPAVARETAHLLPTTASDLIVSGDVLVDVDGYEDDGVGTWTGTPNALIEKPADVLNHLAQVVGGIPSGRVDSPSFVTARGDAPASHRLAGVVTDRSTNLKELLIALGLQSRIRIDWPADKLTAQFLKSSYGAISKVLTQENVMTDGGRTTLNIKKSDVTDILNVINLRYGRDWSASRTADSFKKVSSASDATSIARYGQREQAERFLCDFIPEDAGDMADDVAAFFLARYKEPWRIVGGDFKLDQYELLPGDVIGMSFFSRLASSAGVTFPYTFPMTFGGVAVAGQIFDGLNGTQKFLIQEVRYKAGGARDRSPTRMPLVMIEVN